MVSSKANGGHAPGKWGSKPRKTGLPGSGTWAEERGEARESEATLCTRLQFYVISTCKSGHSPCLSSKSTAPQSRKRSFHSISSHWRVRRWSIVDRGTLPGAEADPPGWGAVVWPAASPRASFGGSADGGTPSFAFSAVVIPLSGVHAPLGPPLREVPLGQSRAWSRVF